MSVKNLGRLGVPFHGPVIHRGLGHQGNHILRDPLPKYDIIRHGVGLHLGLHFNVEDLQSFLGWK